VGPTPRKALGEDRGHTREVSYAGSEVAVYQETEDQRVEEQSQQFAIEFSTSYTGPAAAAPHDSDGQWRKSQLNRLPQYNMPLGASAFRNISESREEEPGWGNWLPDRTPRKQPGCENDHTHEVSYAGSEMQVGNTQEETSGYGAIMDLGSESRRRKPAKTVSVIHKPATDARVQWEQEYQNGETAEKDARAKEQKNLALSTKTGEGESAPDEGDAILDELDAAIPL